MYETWQKILAWLSILVVALCLYWWWLAYRTAEINKQIKAEIRHEFGNREDRWKNYDMQRWAEQLKERNPVLDVPKVKKIDGEP